MSHYLSQSQPFLRVTSATVWNDEQVQVKYTDYLVTDQTICHMPHTSSAYKTHTKHGRQSDTHTPYTPSAYKTRTKHGQRHTPHSPLPTRPTWSMVAGQRHTHSTLSTYIQDPHEAWSPVRDTHSHTLHTPSDHQSETHTPYTISTRPNHQSETVTPYTLYLQDPHETWSLVSHTHPTLSTYKAPYKAWSTIWEMHTTHF